jgi:hypothetical protein
MPTTYAVPDGRTVMAATLYSANNGAQTISNAVNGISFQPDFVWTKSRSNAYGHCLYDSVRGVYKVLVSNSTTSETTDTLSLTAFNSNGYSLNANDNSNYLTGSSVGWQWKAGGTSSSNTNGSITSTVSVGATQGFSVVTYTLNNSTFTVGHGLGVAPNMIIVKDRDTTNNWDIYHSSIGAGSRLTFTTSTPDVSSQVWNNTAPTSTVFSGNSAWWTNPSTSKMVAYCFSAVAGYSAFGSYTGNGSATAGPFVYLGFRPRLVMVKRYDTGSTGNWTITDTSINPYNNTTGALRPNTAETESTIGTVYVQPVSNGFYISNNNSDTNASGGTYVYACWAENPFKYANAR